MTRAGQIVWGLRYIDDAVLRRVAVAAAITDDTEPMEGLPSVTVDWDDTPVMGERTARKWWYLTDAQFSVVALADNETAGQVAERVEYTPYGEVAKWYSPVDINGDGTVSADDVTAFLDLWFAQNGICTGPNCSADFSHNGTVGGDDIFAYSDAYFPQLGTGALPYGWIGRPTALGGGGPGADNPVGYCGYIHNPETGDYTARYRVYSPRLGQWLERDPIEFDDGVNLYSYTHSNPIAATDPFGLETPISFPKTAKTADEQDKLAREIESALQKLCPAAKLEIVKAKKGNQYTFKVLNKDEKDDEDDYKKQCGKLSKACQDGMKDACSIVSRLNNVKIKIDNPYYQDNYDYIQDVISWAMKSRAVKKREGDKGGDKLVDDRDMESWEVLWHELVHFERDKTGKHKGGSDSKSKATEEIETTERVNKFYDWARKCLKSTVKDRDPYGHGEDTQNR